MHFESSRLVLVLFLETIGLCLIASFRLINVESTAMLLIFNLLFLSLAFQLNGPINRKIGMLALGNIIGLFWGYVLYFFSIAGVMFFGEGFNVFSAIFYPFLNF